MSHSGKKNSECHYIAQNLAIITTITPLMNPQVAHRVSEGSPAFIIAMEEPSPKMSGMHTNSVSCRGIDAVREPSTPFAPIRDPHLLVTIQGSKKRVAHYIIDKVK